MRREPLLSRAESRLTVLERPDETERAAGVVAEAFPAPLPAPLDAPQALPGAGDDDQACASTMAAPGPILRCSAFESLASKESHPALEGSMRMSIALLVVLLVGVLLGGCGGEPSTTGGKATTGETTGAGTTPKRAATTEETTVEVTTPKGKTTLASSEIEQKAEEAKQQVQTQGTNKAGQDISNIPVQQELSPQEQAARWDCVMAYYNSLPRTERRQIAAQIVEQANAQGVNPADLVGC